MDAAVAPWEIAGGVPFLDDGFATRTVLAGVAARRAWVVGVRGENQAGSDPRLLLAPSTAQAIRASEGIRQTIPSALLDRAHAARVEAAIGEIRHTMPEWAPLFELPIQFRLLLDTESISCSCLAWPQHVFLSEDAFCSDAELQEQLIHEICHNWLYLVQELWRLHPHREDQPLFRLPSGTSNRNVSEVIGAAHVTASLVRWYERRGGHQARIAYLREYLRGCIRLLDEIGERELTGAGYAVAGRLRDASLARGAA